MLNPIPTNYGYTTSAGVYSVWVDNGTKLWIVAATMGEAVDCYLSGQLPNFITEEFPWVNARLVGPNEVLTSDSNAGASSGVSATAQAWATTYNTAVAPGLSGTNSSQGTQIILKRTS
jgi:hypothetical protein